MTWATQIDMSRVREHMEGIEADGIYIGTVDRVEDASS
jgi:hypothetical protein